VSQNETAYLKTIHLKFLILFGIITPTVTATGAYWSLKAQVSETDRKVSERVLKVENEADKTFVDKQQFQNLASEVRAMHDDVLEIKTLLNARRGTTR